MLSSTLLLLASLWASPHGESSWSRPDKFWFEAPEAAQVEGSAPAFVEGVLLDETDDAYHVRVVGGEVWLPKAQVVKVEKDRLTTQRIERAEQKAAEDAQKAAAESAPPAGEGEVDEVATEVAEPPCCDPHEELAVVEEFVATAPVVPPHYDPVLHVLRVDPACSDWTLIRDLELAYEVTRDRTYIKLLRVMRRLR
ncbi:MAG: hypothetical protein AB7O97_19290 [Planctomycetota bacterium]